MHAPQPRRSAGSDACRNAGPGKGPDVGPGKGEGADAVIAVSVIVPAFNEEAHISRCLEALAAQTLPKARFEVVVVDNGSTDATPALARAHGGALQLQVLTLARATISAARNQGAALGRGPVLAFLDADCLPRPDWLALVLACAHDRRIWGAHYLLPPDATWVGSVWFRYQATEQQGPVDFLPGGDLCIAKAEFARLGGFAEHLKTSEDVDLCRRAAAAGLEVLAFPELGVFHLGTPRTLRGFYRQNRWHGEHVLRVFLANLPGTRYAGIVSLSFYTLAMFWATRLVPVLTLPHGHGRAALLPLFLLLLPPCLLALQKTARGAEFERTLPLAVLYLVYLLARAASLVHLSRPRHR